MVVFSPGTAEGRRCGCGSFCSQVARQTGPSDDWDGQDDRADEHGSTAARRSEGGARVAEMVGSGDEISCKTSVWAISACPAKNRKII